MATVCSSIEPSSVVCSSQQLQDPAVLLVDVFTHIVIGFPLSHHFGAGAVMILVVPMYDDLRTAFLRMIQTPAAVQAVVTEGGVRGSTRLARFSFRVLRVRLSVAINFN
jgi:hypothetical protein